VIYDEAARMHRLVEQLLELARLDAGQITMAHVPVDLRELLSACVDRQRLRAQEREVTLALNAPDSLLVTGDPDRLFQVFTNLLDNALTYTLAGGRVEISGESVQKDDGNWAVVSVTDNGPGILAEDLPRLFERFYRVDKARQHPGLPASQSCLSPVPVRHRTGWRSGQGGLAQGAGGAGFGLGLAIVKEFVEAHGGRVQAESVVGLGTRFTVRLPATSVMHETTLLKNYGKLP
jgi:signal transduction histidine kinase